VELWPILVLNIGKANVDTRGDMVIDTTAGRSDKVVVGTEAICVVEDAETDQAFCIQLEFIQIDPVARAAEIGFGMDILRLRLIEFKEASFGFNAVMTPYVDVRECRGSKHPGLAVLEVILRGGSAGGDGDAVLKSGGHHLGRGSDRTCKAECRARGQKGCATKKRRHRAKLNQSRMKALHLCPIGEHSGPRYFVIVMVTFW
jgi:hypothetical protein